MSEQLFEASRKGNLKTLLTLIESGVDVNAKSSTGKTALLWAALYGRSDCMYMLIKAGADVNAQAKYGYTALMYAGRWVWSYSPRILPLIEAGAIIDSLDNTLFKEIIKNNIYTVDVLKNTAFNRRKNALLFYKIRCFN